MNRRIIGITWAIQFVLSTGIASANAPLFFGDPEIAIPPSDREAFYCQDPDYMMVYNIVSCQLE